MRHDPRHDGRRQANAARSRSIDRQFAGCARCDGCGVPTSLGWHEYGCIVAEAERQATAGTGVSFDALMDRLGS